jgi:hypothetical protein
VDPFLKVTGTLLLENFIGKTKNGFLVVKKVLANPFRVITDILKLTVCWKIHLIVMAPKYELEIHSEN